MHNKTLYMIAFLLLIVGGLNWLLLGVFQWEIGALFGGSGEMISRAIYVLVGLAAIYELATYKFSHRTTGAGEGGAPTMGTQ